MAPSSPDHLHPASSPPMAFVEFVWPAIGTWTWDPSRYHPPAGDVSAPGWRPVPCRSCGALVLFFTTRNEKKAPLNPDGTSHFATCPQAQRWRRR